MSFSFPSMLSPHNYCINETINDSENSRIETAFNNYNTILGYIPSDIANAPTSGSILH